MSALIAALEWRYATQKFDPTKKITPAERSILLESARLAPSSFGLQPWKCIVVQNPETRQAIRQAAWGQAQITEASDLFVFCTKTTLDAAYIDHFVELTAEIQGRPVTEFTKLQQTIRGVIASRSASELFIWNSRQTYIAVGMLLAAAASHRIDVSPMEGFKIPEVDAILGLSTEHLTASVLCAVGHRLPTDPAALVKKVRFPFNELITYR